jgi:hypothetical protein
LKGLKKMGCTICKEKAEWKSTHTPNLFYCSKCSEYVAAEYGMARIERIKNTDERD